jgi:hypothetical protein
MQAPILLLSLTRKVEKHNEKQNEVYAMHGFLIHRNGLFAGLFLKKVAGIIPATLLIENNQSILTNT